MGYQLKGRSNSCNEMRPLNITIDIADGPTEATSLVDAFSYRAPFSSPLVEHLSATFPLCVVRVLDLHPRRSTAGRLVWADRELGNDAFHVSFTHFGE
jgi:hypothetical protein